jgi:hypothetical protein
LHANVKREVAYRVQLKKIASLQTRQYQCKAPLHKQ